MLSIGPNATSDENSAINIRRDNQRVGIQKYPTGEYILDVSGAINCGAIFVDGAQLSASSGGGGVWTQDASDNISYSLGNVGIGTTDPSYALDVSGDMRASGDMYASGDLYADSDLYASGDLYTTDGDLFLTGDISMEGDVLTTGDMVLDGSMVIGKSSFDSSGYALDVSGDVQIVGGLDVSGTINCTELLVSGVAVQASTKLTYQYLRIMRKNDTGMDLVINGLQVWQNDENIVSNSNITDNVLNFYDSSDNSYNTVSFMPTTNTSYKLKITSNNSNTYLLLTEVELFDNSGNSIDLSNSDSSSTSSGNVSSEAYDGIIDILGNLWHSSRSSGVYEWWSADFNVTQNSILNIQLHHFYSGNASYTSSVFIQTLDINDNVITSTNYDFSNGSDFDGQPNTNYKDSGLIQLIQTTEAENKLENLGLDVSSSSTSIGSYAQLTFLVPLYDDDIQGIYLVSSNSTDYELSGCSIQLLNDNYDTVAESDVLGSSANYLLQGPLGITATSGTVSVTESYTNINSETGALFSSPGDIVAWTDFSANVEDVSLNQTDINMSANTITIDGDLNVNSGLDVSGTITTNGDLNVGGTAYASGSALTSDDRVKHNEEDISGLELITQLHPQKYLKTRMMYAENYTLTVDASGNYTNLKQGDRVDEEMGIIAQDVLNIPELSFCVTDSTPYAVNYNNLFVLSIQAIKELKAKNDALQTSHDALQALLRSKGLID